MTIYNPTEKTEPAPGAPTPWKQRLVNGFIAAENQETGELLVLNSANKFDTVIHRLNENAANLARIAELEAQRDAMLAACERALAIEKSVTQGQERELRQGYRTILVDALAAARKDMKP